MIITVKEVVGSLSEQIIVDEDCDLAGLQMEIQRSVSIPVRQQRLVYKGKPMDKPGSLASFGVANGATVYILRKMDQSWEENLFIQTLSGENLTLDYSENDTVADVKIKCRNATDTYAAVQASDLILILKGGKLDDDGATLRELGVPAGGSMHCMKPPKETAAPLRTAEVVMAAKMGINIDKTPETPGDTSFQPASVPGLNLERVKPNLQLKIWETAFQRIDAKKSGYLSRLTLLKALQHDEDLQNLLGFQEGIYYELSRQGAWIDVFNKVLQDMDTNHDGKVSWEEFRAAMQRLSMGSETVRTAVQGEGRTKKGMGGAPAGAAGGDCVSCPQTLSEELTTLWLLSEGKQLSGSDFTRAKGMCISGTSPGLAKNIFDAYDCWEQGTLTQQQFDSRKQELLYPRPAAPRAPSSGQYQSSMVDQVKELWAMHKEGALTLAEFQQMKAGLLGR